MAAIKPSRNPFLDGESQTPPPTSTSEASSPSSAPTQSQTNFPSPPRVEVPQSQNQVLTRTPSLSRFPWRKYLWPFLIVLLILLIIAGVYYWWRSRPITPAEVTPPTSPATIPNTSIETPREPSSTQESDAQYSSENFKVGEIVIGGEAEFFLSESDTAPLALSGIRGEAFTEKNKQEVKLVVTWKSNRLSQAEIEYSKGVGQATKSISEDDYSFNHSVILTGLDPASTYLYSIVAEDRFGNVVRSEPYAVFTGSRTVSLFDLIAGAIGDVFGWAVDK